MADFSIPRLPSHAKQFGICIIIFDSKDPRLIEWTASHLVEDAVSPVASDDGQEWLWMHIELMESNAVHFHLQLSRTRKDDSDAVEQTMDDAVKICGEFLDVVGTGEYMIRSYVRLAMTVEDLPPDGVIAKLLGFSQTSLGAALTLKSGELRIDDDAFWGMTFNHDMDKDLVFVELTAFTESRIDGGLFKRAAELMDVGVECYVYEQISRESPNA